MLLIISKYDKAFSPLSKNNLPANADGFVDPVVKSIYDVCDIFPVFKDNVFPSYVKPDCAIAPSAVPSEVKTLVNAGS